MSVTGTDSILKDEAVKVGNPVVYNLPLPASYSTSAATYQAADIIGGIIVHDTTSVAATATLPTPSSLATQFDSPRVGDTVECLIINGGVTGSITLSGVTGVSFDTNQLTVSRVIQNGSSKYVMCRFTNVTAGSQAYTVYS